MKRVFLLTTLLVLIVSASLMAGGQAAAEEHKLAVVAVKHPYFAPMETAAQDYEANTGVETDYRATQHFDMEEENVIIEGMMTTGYNGFAMWPGHPDSVNATVSELMNEGLPAVFIGGQASLPTDAPMCIATDVGASAATATENLIEAMGGEGNILNLLGALSDPNTLIRKDAIEKVAAQYPDVQILEEISGIDAFEAATTKLDAFLSARSDEVDGIVSTAYVASVVAAQQLRDMGGKRMKAVLIDDDSEVLNAIRDGYVTGTMSQAPYGQAYLGLEAVRLLREGYTVKEGEYFVDSGSFMIHEGNVDTYADTIKRNALEMLETFEEDYFVAPSN